MADKMKGKLMMGRRTFVEGGLAAGAMAALGACANTSSSSSGGSDTGSAVVSSGNMITYYLNNPACIEPYNLQEDQGTTVAHSLFDTLLGYDFEKSELVPLAAESYDVNDDATVFTFHLVKDATFHNGDAVDAASFKRSWERICNPNTKEDDPSVISYHLSMVQGYDDMQLDEANPDKKLATELTGVEAVDDTTLQVTLTQSYADFPYVCTHAALGPVPQAALDDPDGYWVAPIGNGPFKMDGQWEDGQYISIVKYDDYYGTASTLDTVYFNIQKDVETAYREFQAGNIDVAQVPTSQTADAISQYGESSDGYTITPGAQVLMGDEPSTYYLAVNVKDATFQDVNLRRAVSMAINRQAICDTLFDGTRSPAGNIVPPGIDGYEADAWSYSKYDVDAATEILDASYPADADGNRGVTITLSCNSDGGHEQIMESIQGDLANVGITAEISTSEWATYLDDLQNGNYQIGRLGWVADYPIMDNFLYPLFYTGNGDNRSQYSNTEVDAAMNAARSTVDHDARIAALQQVNATIANDMPVIPIMFYKHGLVGSERVQSLYIDPQKKPSFFTAAVTDA